MNWVFQLQYWDLLAITFFIVGSISTIISNFCFYEKFQKIGFFCFCFGVFFWSMVAIINGIPIALLQMQKIGFIRFICALLFLFVSLYVAKVWVETDKYIWLVFFILASSIIVFFVWDGDGLLSPLDVIDQPTSKQES